MVLWLHLYHGGDPVTWEVAAVEAHLVNSPTADIEAFVSEISKQPHPAPPRRSTGKLAASRIVVVWA